MRNFATAMLGMMAAIAFLGGCAREAAQPIAPSGNGNESTGMELAEALVPATDLDASAIELDALQQSLSDNIVRSRLVKVNPGIFVEGESFTLTAFGGETLTVKWDGHRTTHFTGAEVWVGHLQGEKLSEVIIVNNNGVMAGDIRTQDSVYELRWVGPGVHALRECDPSLIPGAGECSSELAPAGMLVQSGLAPAITGLSRGKAVGDPTIDIMINYTVGARAEAGGDIPIQSIIDLAVAQTNEAYANSAVSQRLRLVYSGAETYTPYCNPDLSTELSRLVGTGDGFFSNSIIWRNIYGADLMCVLVSSYYSGYYTRARRSYTMGSPASTDFAPLAASVMVWSFVASNHNLGHTTGHNCGVWHERSSPGAPSNGSYDFAHGYYAPDSAFTTIMSNGLSPVSHYSNPNIDYGGQPTGVDHGVDPLNSADNAQALNLTASIVAAFQATKVPEDPTLTTITITPGTASLNAGDAVQFSAQGYDEFGDPFATTFAWTASGGTVDATGYYTSPDLDGTFQVTATSGAVSGNAIVTVTRPPSYLASVSIAPGNLPLAPGANWQFGVSGVDQYGDPFPINGTVTWSTTDGPVDGTGLFTAPTADGPYTVTITALADGVEGFAFARIQDPNNIVRGDCDGTGTIDVADLVFLVGYMFQSGVPSAYLKQNDVDGSGSVDVADLVYLVAYMFSGGEPPPP